MVLAPSMTSMMFGCLTTSWFLSFWPTSSRNTLKPHVFCAGSHSMCDESWLLIMDLVIEVLFYSSCNRSGVAAWTNIFCDPRCWQLEEDSFLSALSGVACLDRSSCSLSLSNISCSLMCAFINYNYRFFLSISNSDVYPDIFMLSGGRCPVVVGVPCSGDSILIVGSERYCCAVSASRVHLAVLVLLIGQFHVQGMQLLSALLDLGLLASKRLAQ